MYREDGGFSKQQVSANASKLLKMNFPSLLIFGVISDITGK